MLIRTARAYRTVSNPALSVVASTIPIDLKAEERSRCFGKSATEKKEERENTLTLWQERWLGSELGQWTRTLIPDVRPWFLRKHGQTDFHLTQALTGHGSFGSYLFRFKKRTSPRCLYCEEQNDTPLHTIFECNRWDFERDQLQLQLGKVITTTNLVNTMLTGETEWNLIGRYINFIIRQKEEYEIQLQSTSYF